MNPQDASTWFSVLMAIVASTAGILSWSARKHWGDLEKRLEHVEGDCRLFVERIHQIAVEQAKGTAISQAVADLKHEVQGMRRDLYGVRRIVESRAPPPER